MQHGIIRLIFVGVALVLPALAREDANVPPLWRDNDLTEGAAAMMELPTTRSLSVSVTTITSIEIRAAVITPPPVLLQRMPEPQAPGDCVGSVSSASSEAARLASQSIQQANQSAQQSVAAASRSVDQEKQNAARQITQAQQQASQSIDQAKQQASREVTQSVQQAQQSASQEIAQAQRSFSQLSSSASAAISRASVSASSAINDAQAARSSLSEAIRIASGAVAAATGSAAAAGQSFLRAAASVTVQSTASASAVGAAANAQVIAANQQAEASQSAAITATQAAIAIVGSIIASALITILVYFLISRRTAKLERQREKDLSDRLVMGFGANFSEKDPIVERSTALASSWGGTTQAAPSTRAQTGTMDTGSVAARFHRVLSQNSGEGTNLPAIKTTDVSWAPDNPPPPPTIKQWLKVQEVSPFAPIIRPLDSASRSTTKAKIRNIFQPKFDPNPDRRASVESDFEKPDWRDPEKSEWRDLASTRTSQFSINIAQPKTIAYPPPVRTLTAPTQPAPTEAWLAERSRRLVVPRDSTVLQRNKSVGLSTRPGPKRKEAWD